MERANTPYTMLGAFASVSIAVLSLQGHARAADQPYERIEAGAPAPASGWTFTVSAYFWMSGIDGDVGQFGLPPVHVDMRFADIVETLDFGAMTVGEARYGRFGLFSDLIYVKTSDSSGTPRGVLANRVGVDQQSLVFTGAGEYRLIESPGGTLDAMAGFRVWSVDTDLAFTGGLLNGVRRSDGDTWVDPLVGVRGRVHLTDRVFLNGWAMVGGFGVASDVMWDVLAGVGYDFNDTVSAAIGYRAMGVDFQDGAFVYDIVQQGPVLGMIVRF